MRNTWFDLNGLTCPAQVCFTKSEVWVKVSNITDYTDGFDLSDFLYERYQVDTKFDQWKEEDDGAIAVMKIK